VFTVCGRVGFVDDGNTFGCDATVMMSGACPPPAPSVWKVWIDLPAIAASVPLVVLAVVVGAAQYLSLPSATDPRPIWIVLPLIAAVSAAVGLLLALREMRFAADAAMLLVGAELAVWGFMKRDGLGAAIVPTDAPFWLDRFTTAAALVGGVVFVAIAVWSLFVVPAPDGSSDASEPLSDSRERSGSPRPAHP